MNDLTESDPTLTSLLRHMPRDVRALVSAVDDLRSKWASANEETRHRLWSAVDDACEVVRPSSALVTPGLLALASEIDDERQRQIARFGAASYPDGTGRPGARERANQMRAACKANGPSEDNWQDIAAEEDAEVAAETDPARLRAELIQAITVKAAWVLDLDRRIAASREANLSDAA
jgi:hypothetical protein